MRGEIEEWNLFEAEVAVGAGAFSVEVVVDSLRTCPLSSGSKDRRRRHLSIHPLDSQEHMLPYLSTRSPELEYSLEFQFRISVSAKSRFYSFFSPEATR